MGDGRAEGQGPRDCRCSSDTGPEHLPGTLGLALAVADYRLCRGHSRGIGAENRLRPIWRGVFHSESSEKSFRLGGPRSPICEIEVIWLFLPEGW